MDALTRALEREIAAGSAGVETRLRYARAVERQGRVDDALDALLPALDDAEVRRAVGRFPAWDEIARANDFIDAAPLRSEPVVAWRSEPTRDSFLMLASALALFWIEEQWTQRRPFVRVLDPFTGELRKRLPGRLRAFDAWVLLDTGVLRAHDIWSGRRRGSKSVERPRPHIVAVAGDRILAEEARDGGRKVWEVDADHRHPFCVTSDVLICLGDGAPLALDRRSGRLLWTLRGAPDRVGEWLADGRGLVAFTATHESYGPEDEHEVVAFDLSGKRLWRRKEPARACALLPERILGIVDYGARFVVLDRATGRRVAAFGVRAPKQIPDDPLPSSLAVARDVLYVGDHDGSVTALTLEGERLWRVDVAPGERIFDLVAVHRRLFGRSSPGGMLSTLFCLAPDATRPARSTPVATPRRRREPPIDPAQPGDLPYAESATFEVGQTIFHPSFGRGRVVRATSSSIHVAFRRSRRSRETTIRLVHARSSRR